MISANETGWRADTSERLLRAADLVDCAVLAGRVTSEGLLGTLERIATGLRRVTVLLRVVGDDCPDDWLTPFSAEVARLRAELGACVRSNGCADENAHVILDGIWSDLGRYVADADDLRRRRWARPQGARHGAATANGTQRGDAR